MFDGQPFMVNPPERHFEINPITSPYVYRAASRVISKKRRAKAKAQPRNRRGRFVSRKRAPAKKYVARKRSGVKRVASTSTGERKMAKRRTAAQRAATRKLIAFNKRRRRGGGGRKRSRGRSSARRRGQSYAAYKRRRRRPRTHLSPARRYSQRGRAPSSRVRRAGRTLRARRWALRGNPPFFRDIIGTIRQGAMDAAGVVGGEITTNLIEGFIPDVGPLSSASAVGKVVKRTGAAFLTGYAATRFLGYQWGRMALAGGLASVIKTGIRGVASSLPAGRVQNAVNQALSGDDNYAGYGIGAYPPSLALPGVGSYPEMGVGDDEYAYVQQ